MPISRTFALDRIPTMVDLYKIVDHSDIRGKELTLVLFLFRYQGRSKALAIAKY